MNARREDVTGFGQRCRVHVPGSQGDGTDAGAFWAVVGTKRDGRLRVDVEGKCSCRL